MPALREVRRVRVGLVLFLLTGFSMFSGFGNAAPSSAEPSSSAKENAEARFPAFRDMGRHQSSGPVVLHGIVVGAEGEPLEGVEVLLSTEPSLETKRAMKPGDTYELVPLARAVTDANGQYVLRSEFTPQARMRHGTDGLGLELDLFTEDRHHVRFSQTTYRPGTGWGRPEAGGSPGDGGLGRHGGNRENISLDPESGALLPDDVVWPEHEQPMARHHQGTGCSSWAFQYNRIPRETVATAVARNGVSIDVRYTSSASTSSGMGFAVAPGGNWTGVKYSQSGTSSRSSTYTAGFSRQTAPSGSTIKREYRVEYRHKVYDRHCWIGCHTCGDPTWELQRRTDPDLVTGGAGVYDSRYADFSCKYAGTRVGPGVDNVSTSNATATTYGSAFSITAGATFNGTARSGYNSNVKVTYRFNTSNGGYWCGNNDYPATAGRTRAWR